MENSLPPPPRRRPTPESFMIPANLGWKSGILAGVPRSIDQCGLTLRLTSMLHCWKTAAFPQFFVRSAFLKSSFVFCQNSPRSLTLTVPHACLTSLSNLLVWDCRQSTFHSVSTRFSLCPLAARHTPIQLRGTSSLRRPVLH